MCQRSIVLPAGRQRLEGLALGVFATLIIAGAAVAQRPGAPHPDWRHIGNSVVGMALAAPASGPGERLWYSPGLPLPTPRRHWSPAELAAFEPHRLTAGACTPMEKRSCAPTTADAPGPTSLHSADAPSSAAAFAIWRFRRSTARKWSPQTRTGCGGRSTVAHPGQG